MRTVPESRTVILANSVYVFIRQNDVQHTHIRTKNDHAQRNNSRNVHDSAGKQQRSFRGKEFDETFYRLHYVVWFYRQKRSFVIGVDRLFYWQGIRLSKTENRRFGDSYCTAKGQFRMRRRGNDYRLRLVRRTGGFVGRAFGRSNHSRVGLHFKKRYAKLDLT